jgi:Mn2+/Fe2+ NRAMP family transporter
VAAATAFTTGAGQASLSSIGEISGALTPVLGESAGRIVFSAGVLGAALIAAIVSSLALAWGVGEVAGYRRSLESRPFEAKWFYGVYAACVAGSAAVVWFASNLIWLNVAAQVLNAFLMPLVIGFLVALAVKALPEPYRPRRWYLALIVGVSAVVSAVGVFGGVQALM